ncbi:hypothetical protein B0T24DRAFT_539700 [Lasiosphaeria ovina]|uniref:Uncharacterized protein n=1 Tax=Lasiosphaeria ovina TaxID=92902 RepID=A0AAE0MYC6_9PEZI|nr:hypothetical protein B0T24DRAFT_539700 [Lasiosphaeria ovina]
MVLEGEKNLQQWDGALWALLNIYDLQKYILEEVKEPEVTEDTPPEQAALVPQAKKDWRTNRAIVVALINNSLSPRVHEKLIARNWDPRGTDPKVTYDLIKEVIPRITQEAVLGFIAEYVRLDRQSFTTMQAYLTRVRFLFNKINELKADISETFHINLLIINLKKSYPERHLFWLNGLKEKTLTSQKLNAELEEIATSEETTTRFAKLPLARKNSTGKGDNSNKKFNRDEKKTCEKAGCGETIPAWFVHKPCGHHGGKSNGCWTCDPETAPDYWKGKKKALEDKKKREATTSTTAVVVHNASGLSNPSTQTDSSLLFSTNFYTPQVNLPKEDPARGLPVEPQQPTRTALADPLRNTLAVPSYTHCNTKAAEPAEEEQHIRQPHGAQTSVEPACPQSDFLTSPWY